MQWLYGMHNLWHDEPFNSVSQVLAELETNAGVDQQVRDGASRLICIERLLRGRTLTPVVSDVSTPQLSGSIP